MRPLHWRTLFPSKTASAQSVSPANDEARPLPSANSRKQCRHAGLCSRLRRKRRMAWGPNTTALRRSHTPTGLDHAPPVGQRQGVFGEFVYGLPLMLWNGWVIERYARAWVDARAEQSEIEARALFHRLAGMPQTFNGLRRVLAACGAPHCFVGKPQAVPLSTRPCTPRRIIGPDECSLCLGSAGTTPQGEAVPRGARDATDAAPPSVRGFD